MSDSLRKSRIGLGLVGAAVGGVAGFFVFQWIFRQGFYALIIPGASLGLVGGYCVRGRSVPFAILCGIAGLALGLFTEWRFFPFAKDESLVYYITHIQGKRPITLIMLAIGTVISFRLALGMDEKRPSTFSDR